MNEATNLQNSHNLPSVLVVDDDIDTLDEVCELVSALGLAVIGVDSVTSALMALSEDENIGLIVTDLKMNVMDGFDLLEELKVRYGHQRSLATIVLSGHPSFDNALESLRLGVNDFVEKPASIANLKMAIRRAFYSLEFGRNDNYSHKNELLNKDDHSENISFEKTDLSFVKELQKQRVRRKEIIASPLFSDPAWDILLDLMAANLANQAVSVSSACAAAQVPFSTGLRYVNRLVAEQLAIRISDPNDRRRDLLELTPQGLWLMSNYVQSLNRGPEPEKPNSKSQFLK